MQSSSRTYESGGRCYRYRYAAATPGRSLSKHYVDLTAARKLLDKISKTWPGSRLMRIREILDAEGRIQAREYEVEQNHRWIPEKVV